MANMKLHVVVARYKEDVSWIEGLRALRPDTVFTVYNKHSGDNLLPNVGREAHTYVHHILADYDDPADHYLFLQGSPFDHLSDRDAIARIIRDYDSRHSTSDYIPMKSEIFDDLNGYPHSCRKGGIPVGALYEALFGEGTSPQVFEFSPGACFLVRGSLLRRLTREQWADLHARLSKNVKAVEAYCLERLWKTFFVGPSVATHRDIPYDRSGFSERGEYFARVLRGSVLKIDNRNLGVDR